jgi:hypothetical protein
MRGSGMAQWRLAMVALSFGEARMVTASLMSLT